MYLSGRHVFTMMCQLSENALNEVEIKTNERGA